MFAKAREEVRGMLPALLLHGVQWFLAYLSLDLLFRTADVRPASLARSRVRYMLLYGLQAAAATLLIGALQLRLVQAASAPGGGPAASAPGAVLAVLGVLPWWLLWRFGWRKQFPHLYQRPPRGRA